MGKIRREKGKEALARIDPTTQHTCKNCGHVDTGRFCSACGQSFTEYSKPLKELLGDLAGIFSLDSSIFRTIGPFLFKPGFLSREYLNGKRKFYMSPVRLYLFLSIVFFFVANEVTINSSAPLKNFTFSQSTDSTRTEIVADDQFFESLKKDTSFVVVGGDTIFRDSVSATYYDKFIDSGLKTLENPSLFITDFYKNISYALFLLMPIFALILQLLYVRRKRYYVEHLIFTLNMHSFVLLVLTILALLQFLIKRNDDFTVILALVIPVYFLAGMKRFYEQKFWKIFLKSIILWIIYILLLISTMLALVYLTFIRM